MSRICPLFSSSSANSTYIATKSGSVMIDAGASFRKLKTSVESAGGIIEDVSAVFVTHEHSDHIAGLKTLLKKTGAKLIASDGTLDALINANAVPEGTETVSVGENSIDLGDFSVTRFPTSHDCNGSSGYSFTLPDGKRVTVCTDLGIVTDAVREVLTGSDVVLLESNHDLDMLKKGPYPATLKMRIMSDLGHLSNNACAAELQKLIKSGTTRIILGHLSRMNNTPLLAESCAKAALVDISATCGKDYLLSVAKPCDNGVTVI